MGTNSPGQISSSLLATRQWKTWYATPSAKSYTRMEHILTPFAGLLQNFPTYGFGAGRVDTWQADEGTYWGSETEMFPKEPGSNNARYNYSTDIFTRADKLESPLGDTNMGLIYVDPQGPNSIPDPKGSALDIRMTFTRMAMNDEETVALIAGGHAFGKTHGAVPGTYIGPEPNAAQIQLQGLGWENSFRSGYGNNTYTSGLEVIWSTTPTKWANEYLHSLLTHPWTLVKSPAGGHQWECLNCTADYPDAFVKGKFHRPRMLTSDLALLHDPVYKNISETFLKDFNYFTEKFALAWCKSPISPQCLFSAENCRQTPPQGHGANYSLRWTRHPQQTSSALARPGTPSQLPNDR